MTRIARAGALLALALLTALALAGPATAKKKPKKHGKGAQTSQTLPKKWAKKHKARAAKADPDGDGLTNWGEWPLAHEAQAGRLRQGRRRRRRRGLRP